MPALPELLQLDPNQFYVGHKQQAAAHYAAGWKLVHFLNHDTLRPWRPAFLGFMHRLSQRESPTVAWNAEFSGFDAEELGYAYQIYRLGSILPVWKTDWSAPLIAPPRTRLMRAGEEQITFMQLELLQPYSTLRMAQVAGWFRAAEKADPEWPGLELWRGIMMSLTKPDPADGPIDQALWAAARRMTLDPRPGLGLLTRWTDRIALAEKDLDKGPHEASVELDALAVELAKTARAPGQLATLARYHALRGRVEDAFALARRALDRDARCGHCLDTMALIAFHRGHVEQAAALQGLAVYAQDDRWTFRVEAEGAYRRWNRYKSGR